MTSSSNPLAEDLHYVREAIDRRGRQRPIPPAIAWAVAVYVAVGYTLLDVNPSRGGLFLGVAGIALGPVCWFLGRRDSVRSGEYDRLEVRRIGLHWLSIVLAIAGVIALGVSRHVDGQVVGQFIALTIGVIYFLAGVHFDRNFLWLGPVLMAGSIAISYVPHYGWTSLGAVIALGLIVPTFFRPRAAAAA
jgi:hypothetical protein